jgi:hypothetical protein
MEDNIQEMYARARKAFREIEYWMNPTSAMPKIRSIRLRTRPWELFMICAMPKPAA